MGFCLLEKNLLLQHFKVEITYKLWMFWMVVEPVQLSISTVWCVIQSEAFCFIDNCLTIVVRDEES